MEYCAAGSIADIMCVLDRPLDEEQIAVVCKFTLKGLQYLHNSMHKIHRDIKAGNILLNQRGRAKLADFGVAGHLADASARRMTVIGTPFWMAPEVVREIGYDFKADIWSLGITAIEMAEMNPPHSDMHPMRAIFLIPSRDPPTLSEREEWSDDFNDFIARCLIKDPEERWSVDQLLKHPFIKTARGPGFLQPLVDEVLEAIEDAGGRDKAMGFSTIDDSKTKQSTGGYVSSGSEPDMYSTIVVRGEEEEEEEEEEDDEGGYGTLVRKDTSKSKKNGSTPAFLKHIQNSKATENEYSKMTVKELKKLKTQLISEKAQKIAEIRQRYEKLRLPEP